MQMEPTYEINDWCKMICKIEELDRHFSNYEHGEDDLIEKNIDHFYVSVFDHWLTENEAEISNIINYNSSIERNKIEEYLNGERRFVDLYRSLSVEGVVCNVPIPLRKIDGSDTALASIIIDSLREKKRFDVYFVAFELRVIGGFDRTDLFLPRNRNRIGEIKKLVKENFLFCLS